MFIAGIELIVREGEEIGRRKQIRFKEEIERIVDRLDSFDGHAENFVNFNFFFQFYECHVPIYI